MPVSPRVVLKARRRSERRRSIAGDTENAQEPVLRFWFVRMAAWRFQALTLIHSQGEAKHLDPPPVHGARSTDVVNAKHLLGVDDDIVAR